jgi:hypothetical protein
VRVTVAAMLIIVGIIHLLPLSGALGAERLAALYGVDIVDANLAILMRHRAVLFGLLGLFFIYAAFRPSVQYLAFIAGLASVLSFIALAYTVGGYNTGIARVVLADWIALVCLLVGAGAAVLASSAGQPIPPGAG